MDGVKMLLTESPAHWWSEYQRYAKRGGRKQYNLSIAVHFGCGESKFKERIERHGVPSPNPDEQLSPEWVEWLMGWPTGWTDLQPLETDKFRLWLHSHGKSSTLN
jgi:hypothetical protein